MHLAWLKRQAPTGTERHAKNITETQQERTVERLIHQCHGKENKKKRKWRTLKTYAFPHVINEVLERNLFFAKWQWREARSTVDGRRPKNVSEEQLACAGPSKKEKKKRKRWSLLVGAMGVMRPVHRPWANHLTIGKLHLRR